MEHQQVAVFHGTGTTINVHVGTHECPNLFAEIGCAADSLQHAAILNQLVQRNLMIHQLGHDL